MSVTFCIYVRQRDVRETTKGLRMLLINQLCISVRDGTRPVPVKHCQLQFTHVTLMNSSLSNYYNGRENRQLITWTGD